MITEITGHQSYSQAFRLGLTLPGGEASRCFHGHHLSIFAGFFKVIQRDMTIGAVQDEQQVTTHFVIIRFNFQRPAITCFGLCKLSNILESIAQIIMTFDIIRFNFQRPTIASFSFC